MELTNGSKVEKVFAKTSIIRSRFSDQFGGFVLCEVKKNGKVRDLPLATMAYQEVTEQVIAVYLRQGVAVSNRISLAA